MERLNIKEYNWWNEALHGVARAGTATVFPQAIGLAASFDEDMMEELGDAIATEARAKFNMQQKFGDATYTRADLLGAERKHIQGPQMGQRA